MGKVAVLIAVVTLLAAATVSPLHAGNVRAQAGPSIACSGAPSTTPMQGHYTGPWHSTADYKFDVFHRDVHLQVNIDGTLDVSVLPNGQIAGTMQGKVDAPLHHDGVHDIGSGYGTITGQITGLFGAGGLMVLSHPVIFMHWGTFVGDGSTQDRYITMPDYQFSVAGSDCVTAQGTVSETNFPQQILLSDETGGITYAIGVGMATGAWQLTSDKHDTFVQLSSRVDDFITAANVLLNDPSATLDAGTVSHRIAQPLKALEDTIRSDPDVARCLLDRLGAWQTAAVTTLLHRAVSMPAAGSWAQQRQAGDLLRSAHVLNLDCGIAEDSTSGPLRTAAGGRLNAAITSHLWADAALALREALLLSGDSGPVVLGADTSTSLQKLIGSTGDARGLLDAARFAYAVGAVDVSRAAARKASAHPVLTSHVGKKPPAHGTKKSKKKPKKKKPKKKSAPTPTSTPTATATPKPTATATATPIPETLEEILAAGIVSMTISPGSGATATLSWQPVSGAAEYVVVVTGPGQAGILWSWSGTATTATYGDTSIPGVVGSENDLWPVALSSAGSSWTVLALDSAGRIIGASFGKKQ